MRRKTYHTNSEEEDTGHTNNEEKDKGHINNEKNRHRPHKQ